jgi:hypothetical protein
MAPPSTCPHPTPAPIAPRSGRGPQQRGTRAVGGGGHPQAWTHRQNPPHPGHLAANRWGGNAPGLPAAGAVPKVSASARCRASNYYTEWATPLTPLTRLETHTPVRRIPPHPTPPHPIRTPNPTQPTPSATPHPTPSHPTPPHPRTPGHDIEDFRASIELAAFLAREVAKGPEGRYAPYLDTLPMVRDGGHTLSFVNFPRPYMHLIHADWVVGVGGGGRGGRGRGRGRGKGKAIRRSQAAVWVGRTCRRGNHVYTAGAGPTHPATPSQRLAPPFRATRTFGAAFPSDLPHPELQGCLV